MRGQDENTIRTDIVSVVADSVYFGSGDARQGLSVIYSSSSTMFFSVFFPFSFEVNGQQHTRIAKEQDTANPGRCRSGKLSYGIVHNLAALGVARYDQFSVGAGGVCLLDLRRPVEQIYTVRFPHSLALDWCIFSYISALPAGSPPAKYPSMLAA
jgi:hypothetical protein